MALQSQQIQQILLKIHQYRAPNFYKPGPKIFTADWLSCHNHKEDKDEPNKIIKRLEGLSAVSFIAAVKIIFAEYGIPCRLMSDAGSNFISEQFKNFCNSLNIKQAVLSSYHHQSNRQVEDCIKLIKCTIKSGQTLVVIYTWCYYK